MSSHRMNRPAPISVFSDKCRTKSTIWSRVSCGTQTPVRVPQLFFLRQHAPPSVRPRPHPSSGSSSPDARFVLARRSGQAVLSAERQPRRSRKTPSASGRTPSAGAPAHHTDPRSALLPPNASSEWRLSLPTCNASVVSSCVRSVILTDERFLHFQLRRDTFPFRELQDCCFSKTAGEPGCFGKGSLTGIRVDRKSTRLNSSHRCISYAV